MCENNENDVKNTPTRSLLFCQKTPNIFAEDDMKMRRTLPKRISFFFCVSE